MFISAGSVKGALTGAECAVFLLDHDVFRGVSMEVKALMASPVVVDGKNLFARRGDCVLGDWERVLLRSVTAPCP
ncbi:hypothetical protein DSECCO2_19130 [anaerobic digester metagenome]